MSPRVAEQIAFPIIQRRVSPMPIGLTPGHLSSAIRRLDTRARMSFHGKFVFANRRERAATASRSHALCAP